MSTTNAKYACTLLHSPSSPGSPLLLMTTAPLPPYRGRASLPHTAVLHRHPATRSKLAGCSHRRFKQNLDTSTRNYARPLLAQNLTVVAMFTAASDANNTPTTASWPFRLATCSGVPPSSCTQETTHRLVSSPLAIVITRGLAHDALGHRRKRQQVCMCVCTCVGARARAIARMSESERDGACERERERERNSVCESESESERERV